MSIYEKNGFFEIRTKNTSYQMQVDSFGVLRHIWYGEITECSMGYLIEYHNVAFSGAVYEAGDDRKYSLCNMPLEYPCGGIGDYRLSTLEITHADGSRAIDLRFAGYRIIDGKYSIEGLPAVYAGEDEAQTLEIYMKDTASETEVVLKYGVLPDIDIITRSAVIINHAEKPIVINNAMSMCLDMDYNIGEWIHFPGRHAMERIPQRRSLLNGIQESSSTRGTSSHQQNPAVVLCSPDTTEQNGSCIGAMLVYSGSFTAAAELDQLDQTRLVMGINPDTFEWTLGKDEQFCTPEAVLSFSEKGLSQLSYNFHRMIRLHICRGKYKTAKRPILINNWEATYFDFNDEKLIEIAKDAAKVGIDMLVMDDGWFGVRNNDRSGLGDWKVNTKKIKGGLKSLVDNVKAQGLDFGIWFEPEMVSEDSDLYRAHPEWVIKIPGRLPNRSRFQLVLDMTRDDVRDYLFNSIAEILNTADIKYVKWDMNRSLCDWYGAEIPPERMGEMPHRYVLGLYSLLERLVHEFPDVLFEGCSGGGGRFDAGILYYCPQIWCSDDTDAAERTKIQYGTSFFYPISCVGAHVSAVPNHQTGRYTSFETRAVTAMSGSFGYELDINKISLEEKNEIKKQIIRFKHYRELIHGGRYYRLSDPTKENIAIWEFAAEDKSAVLVHGVIYYAEANMKRHRIKLAGLDMQAEYICSLDDKIYTGKALCSGGILLPEAKGDYYPVELYFRRKF